MQSTQRLRGTLHPRGSFGSGPVLKVTYDMDTLDMAYVELQKQRDQRCSLQVIKAVRLARTVRVSPQMTNQRQEQLQRFPLAQVMHRQANLQPEHRVLTALRHWSFLVHMLSSAGWMLLLCLGSPDPLLVRQHGRGQAGEAVRNFPKDDATGGRLSQVLFAWLKSAERELPPLKQSDLRAF